jgi:hypothetical protein
VDGVKPIGKLGSPVDRCVSKFVATFYQLLCDALRSLAHGQRIGCSPAAAALVVRPILISDFQHTLMKTKTEKRQRNLSCGPNRTSNLSRLLLKNHESSSFARDRRRIVCRHWITGSGSFRNKKNCRAHCSRDRTSLELQNNSSRSGDMARTWHCVGDSRTLARIWAGPSAARLKRRSPLRKRTKAQMYGADP